MLSPDATRLRLFSKAQNSAGERVRIALNLKLISFDYVAARELPPDDYTAMNPQGLMPTLEVGGKSLTQSLAVLEYLEEMFPEPTILPRDPFLKAKARSFALAVTAEFHSLTIGRVRRHLAEAHGQDAAAVQGWYEHWCATTLGALEAELGRREAATRFCFADYPTIADITLVPQLHNARRFNCDISGYPILGEISARCEDLPAFRDARPDRQPDYTASA